MNKKLISQSWLKKALDDLEWTKANIREKVYYDVGALLEECNKLDKTFGSMRETILPLADYYIQTRYPDISEFIGYDGKKAADALERASKLLGFVQQKI